jgi:hypothetical protein
MFQFEQAYWVKDTMQTIIACSMNNSVNGARYRKNYSMIGIVFVDVMPSLLLHSADPINSNAKVPKIV